MKFLKSNNRLHFHSLNSSFILPFQNSTIFERYTKIEHYVVHYVISKVAFPSLKNDYIMILMWYHIKSMFC